MRPKWRCFHCGQVFTTRRCAAEHFGSDDSKDPACQIKSFEGHLVRRIRDLEAQLDRYRAEDSDVLRAICAQEADHRQALISAEEEGYSRGVQDMKREASTLYVGER